MATKRQWFLVEPTTLGSWRLQRRARPGLALHEAARRVPSRFA